MMRPKSRRKSNIKVRVHYPETEELMEELKNTQAVVMLDILEKQLGSERLDELMEYLKKKINYKSKNSF